MRIGEAQEDLVKLCLGEEVGEELHRVGAKTSNVLESLGFGVLRT